MKKNLCLALITAAFWVAIDLNAQTGCDDLTQKLTRASQGISVYDCFLDDLRHATAVFKDRTSTTLHRSCEGTAQTYYEINNKNLSTLISLTEEKPLIFVLGNDAPRCECSYAMTESIDIIPLPVPLPFLPLVPALRESSAVGVFCEEASN